MSKNNPQDDIIEVDVRELLFIKNNSPAGMVVNIASKLNISRSAVYNELQRIKDSYRRDVVEEARRLIKAVNNLEYSPATEVEN